MATVIDAILLAIENITGVTPAVKGGSATAPLEYTFARNGTWTYRFELDINGKSLDNIQAVANSITNEISDFGDIGKFKGASVTPNGGGFIQNGTRLTQVLYFDVIDYTARISSGAEGTIDIFSNGLWDISKYKYANVHIDGSEPEHEEYDGPLVFDCRRVTQTAATEGKLLTGNFVVNPIKEVPQSYKGGTQLIIGME